MLTQITYSKCWFDTAPCVALHCLCINAVVMQYNSLRFYPHIPLHCVLVFGCQKLDIFVCRQVDAMQCNATHGVVS